MRYSIVLVMLISGCSTIPTDFIKSASEVQADNDKYWAEVEQRRTGEVEVVQATGVILEEAVPVDSNTHTYKLEVFPLGP